MRGGEEMADEKDGQEPEKNINIVVPPIPTPDKILETFSRDDSDKKK